MNLQKLLAENMIRFGVKNLNEQLYKTLLNEGLKPGDPVTPTVALELDTDFNLSAKTELTSKFGKYGKNKVLSSAALLAVAAGATKLSAVNKSINKQHRNVISFVNLLAGNEDRGGFEGPKELAAVDAILQKSANFTYEVTSIAVYPDPRGTGFVATLGKTGDSPGRINDFSAATLEVSNQGKQISSRYATLIKYLSQFNLSNVSDGDFTQYRLSSMLDAENYVDLLKAEVASNTVIVYTATTNNPDEANKAVNTTTQGAAEPIDKLYNVNFAQKIATVPPNDSEVGKAVADAIAMFPDGNITNLSIVSSASPEYGAITNVPGWEKSYPKGITGTGNPGNGTDDASKNIKLAYDRGVNFVAAISAGLAAQGKPEISNPTINWQISDKGGSRISLGRYANVLWSKAGTPGKDVTNVANTGTTGEKISGGKTYTIFQHVFTAV